jgi:hypothetical protein
MHARGGPPGRLLLSFECIYQYRSCVVHITFWNGRCIMSLRGLCGAAAFLALLVCSSGCGVEPHAGANAPRSASQNSGDLDLGIEPPVSSFVGASSSLSLFFANSSSESGSCLNACSGGRSNANCTISPLSETDSGSVKAFYNHLAVATTLQLAPRQLQEMFHIKSDPCGRGVLVVSAKSLNNSGRQFCSLDARIQNPRLRLRILIPQELEGSWTSRSHPMRLSFPSPQHAPVLRFLEADQDKPLALDAERGGIIKLAESDGSRIVVRTTRGCVGVTLK